MLYNKARMLAMNPVPVESQLPTAVKTGPMPMDVLKTGNNAPSNPTIGADMFGSVVFHADSGESIVHNSVENAEPRPAVKLPIADRSPPI